MPKSADASGGDRDRIQAYLSAGEIQEINKLRGRFLTETGRDVRVTQVLRAAVDSFVKLNWTEVRRLLDAQTNRRR
jgi:hypothetical protein